MFPTLNIGPLAVQTSGLILLIGLWIGLYLAERQAAKRSSDAGHIYNLAFLVIISALIGARVAYVLEYSQAFITNPLSLLSLNPILLDWWGGIAGASIASIWYAQKQRLDAWLTLDFFTPTFATLALSLGLAHFASGDAYGTATDLPWAIDLWGAHRHPTQLYGAIAAAIGLLISLRLLNLKQAIKKGIPFLAFVIYSSATRLFLEAFRGDSSLVGDIRLNQLAAWFIMATSLWLAGKRLASLDCSTVKTEDQLNHHT